MSTTTTTEAAGLIRCDTPGHGNVTSTAETWEQEGWGVFAELRRCPECTAFILEGPPPPPAKLAAQILAPEEWAEMHGRDATEAPLLTLPYPRWMAPAYRAASEGKAPVITIRKGTRKTAAPQDTAPDGDAA